MKTYNTTVDTLLEKGYSVKDAHRVANIKFPNNERNKSISFISNISIGQIFNPSKK